MLLKYSLEIDKKAVEASLTRIVNQIYKLLPDREEGIDWKAPLETIIIELSGMDRLLVDQHATFFPLLCKLEGLFELDEEKDFFSYRRTIFEALNLMSSVIEGVKSR